MTTGLSNLAESQNSVSQSPICARTLRTLIIAIAAGVFAGCTAAVWFQSSTGLVPIPWSIIGVAWGCAALIVMVALKLSPAMLVPSKSIAGLTGQGLWLAISIGLALRLVAALLIAPQPTSDGASYLSLAQQILDTGTYGVDGARAFWPPGLPLLLVPLLWIGLSKTVAVLVYGLVTFFALALGMFKLSERLGMQTWSTLPVWMLALWPSHILCAGLPEKELLVMALMPWIVERAIQGVRGSLFATCTAGVLTGIAVLVQPSLQFLPIAATLMAICLYRNPGRIFVAGVTGAALMLAVVAPWTYRNYQVFQVPVLVSTNGGDVLYRANNDKATGTYTPKAAIDLHHKDELTIDRESKHLAAEWIRNNPARFFQLGMGKVLMFLGDDSYGAYASLRKGRPDTNPHVYLAVKLASMIPWLVTWFIVLAFLLRAPLHAGRFDVGAIYMLLVPLLYLMAIHVIFESGPKYHLPILPTVLVLFAYIARNCAPSERPVSLSNTTSA